MSTAVITEPVASGTSPMFKARLAGFFYLLTFVFGLSAMLLVKGRTITGLIAAVCYVVVTLLFYGLFKPVSKRLSMLAAFISLLGCAAGMLDSMHLMPFQINALVFFGFYCLLIGYLIVRSTYLPRFLGVLMALAGLGWLTFFSASLPKILFPWNVVPGMVGEGSLTLWLLIAGVNATAFIEQARASRTR